MWAKTTYWALSETPEDAVKQALKLDGLTESAMKTSPDFKYYQKFLYKAEGVQLRSWVDDRVPPPTVWVNLGLDGVPAPETSRAFKTYVRYVEKYDKRVFKNGYEEFFPRTATDMDMHLKVWAKTNRPDA
ncbi:hypothetical protein PHYSODRAFT_265342 [Phytophthora sojae]|uniref:Uncharacterized protein n=1 Tax=Phytophthora sojae (strain P6497) TaxID=1094619 RepID=G4ZYG8_PHYSP|nr:hypothetical protein PHYSODRAFT_265342 [Phytophthora sojae]EGZ12020.1 hypothetical protein PHYSODRAFT_265342 [Phytophthora sojae]|eukprot:XP_009532353.1 hypothetical protein PHYSODRAFT_265342 [Phytophthora sojae]